MTSEIEEALAASQRELDKALAEAKAAEDAMIAEEAALSAIEALKNN